MRRSLELEESCGSRHVVSVLVFRRVSSVCSNLRYFPLAYHCMVPENALRETDFEFSYSKSFAKLYS